MQSLTIAARSNPWVQQWLRWQAKPSERKASGRVWLEGEHLVTEALTRSAGASASLNSKLPRFLVLEIVLPDTPQARERLRVLMDANQSHAALAAVRVVYLNPSVYAQLCSVNSSPGVCCVVQLQGDAVIDFKQAAVVLDGVQDPGNVGTVLRLCAAFGVSQVILSRGCASAWGAKALRAGQGAQLAVNVAEDADLTQMYAAFQAAGTPIAATSLEAGSVSLAQFKMEQVKQPVVWVFGHEGQGISAATQAAATQMVHIPMHGGFESLNVGSAAAICLWHWSQA